MRSFSKISYWVLGFLGTATWTSAILVVTGLPLPAQLALGAMGLMVCIWGHTVLFPVERPQVPDHDNSATLRPSARALPLGEARRPVGRDLPRQRPSAA
ncbi:hypothetical protein ACVFYP_16880 [Roseomonas sp. F4]